jgi:DNA polymerase III epsilon subunit-like protein
VVPLVLPSIVSAWRQGDSSLTLLVKCSHAHVTDRTLIRVIDIETTGIDPANDAIIEIATIDMVRGGGTTNAMDTLVRPNKPIPPGAPSRASHRR